MRPTLIAAVAAIVLSINLTPAPAFSISSPNPTNVPASAFDLIPERTFPATVSPIQQGGAYRSLTDNSVVTVASGTVTNPSFSLTLTNDTGLWLTSLSLAGNRIQYKDNSSNINETLLGSVSVFTPTISGLDVALVSNTPDAASTVNSPPLTAPYAASLSGFYLAPGHSMTLSWSDTNDLGTDAMFGLSNLSLSPTLSLTPPTPPPHTHPTLRGSLTGFQPP
jgi:hypothetical protein